MRNKGKSVVFLASFLAGAFLAASCSSQEVESHLTHDAGELTRQSEPSRLDWAASSDPLADYVRMVAPRLGKDGVQAQFVVQDHPATLRFQYWLDVFDTLLREENPERMKSIPKPVAKIWHSASANGFVSPLQQCGQVDVRFGEANSADPLAIVGINFSGLLFPSRDEACVDAGSITPAELKEWFDRNNGTCSLSEESGELVVGEDCRHAPALKRSEATRARAFSFFGASPVITLTSGLFRLVETEEQLVGVIAHELGHYYRSHPAMWTAKFNYFYKQNKKNSPHKPLLDESLRELGERAIKASRKKELDEEGKEVLREAHAQRLGYYTYEQEADDIAVELLSRIGIKPSALREKMFHLMQFKNVQDTEFEFGYESCKKLQQSGWRDEQKRYVYVPIGNFANPHHSLCYRVFNIDREVAAHRYVLKNPRIEAPKELSWEDLQKQVEELDKAAGIGDIVADDTVMPEGFFQ